jgi:hypothetical protein
MYDISTSSALYEIPHDHARNSPLVPSYSERETAIDEPLFLLGPLSVQGCDSRRGRLKGGFVPQGAGGKDGLLRRVKRDVAVFLCTAVSGTIIRTASRAPERTSQ